MHLLKPLQILNLLCTTLKSRVQYYLYISQACASDPCLHEGLCLPFQDSYYCSCLSGFVGDQCQFNGTVTK